MALTLRPLTFGIEIEAVGQPWKLREGWVPPQYYERLQKAMQNRGLRAIVDNASVNRKTPEHYDKWVITTDASLRTEGSQVALEAVSPKMSLAEDFEHQIKTFWVSMKIVFKVLPNPYPGTHVHVGSAGTNFDIRDAKVIAFATCIYEPYVFSLLPEDRRQSIYCLRNSLQAGRMGELLKQRTSLALRRIAEDIKACGDFGALIGYMQGAPEDGKRRRVLWNFLNLNRSPTSGHPPTYTIEFRGGRHMRGHVRTLAWMSFAVTFIAMGLQYSTRTRRILSTFKTSCFF